MNVIFLKKLFDKCKFEKLHNLISPPLEKKTGSTSFSDFLSLI